MQRLTLVLAVLISACANGGEKPAPPDRVDNSCRVDADCAVKNVGNCCGYYPACVNKDSPTFPERVQAECAAKGQAGICGFPEISACQCVAGQCRAAAGAAAGTAQ